MKNLSVQQKGDRLEFTFSVSSRSRTKKINYSVEDILKIIKRGHDLQNFVFLKNESSGMVDNVNTSGTYVFRRKSVDTPIKEPTKKPLDIQKKSVKIDAQITETEIKKSKLHNPIIVEEAKEDVLVPSFSETLPYGLKSTAKKTTAKKKRATKKKKIEE